MIKKLHLKTLLLIAALLVGSSSAWADNITYTFSSKDWEASDGTNSANWTDYTSGDSFESADPARGIAKSKATINGTSPEVLSNVSSITVTASANQAGPTLTIYKVVNNVETSIYSASMTKDNNKSYTINLEGTNIFTGKIKVVLASSSSYKSVWIKSVAVTYSAQQKTAHGLSWSATSKDVTYSETPYNLPTLTNPHSLAIEYGSTDESVATIDAEGNVTIKNKTGNTTISAHTDGDATYAAGTVSYTLNVTRKVILEDGVFNFSFGEDYESGMTEGTTIAVNEKTWRSGNITMDVAGRNSWYNDGTFRLYKESGDDAAGSITLTCPSDKVITQIEFTGPYTGTGRLSYMSANTGTYTVTSSSAIWTGAAQSVTFTTGSASTYINTITVTYSNEFTVQVQSYGWASFIAPAPVEFAANTAYVVTAASVANGLTLAAVTTVPAGTPLLLKGAGDKTVTVIASATAPATNLLSIGDGNAFASGSYPYVLAKEGEGACFKQWTGSAATLKGRVVLLLDEALSTRSTYELGDEMTGITGVNLNENQNDNRYYDLQGRHVAQPTKGLYIINGKKVLVK